MATDYLGSMAAASGLLAWKSENGMIQVGVLFPADLSAPLGIVAKRESGGHGYAGFHAAVGSGHGNALGGDARFLFAKLLQQHRPRLSLKRQHVQRFVHGG